jgi:hypothetical protein
VVRFLNRNPGCSEEDLTVDLNLRFPGLQTPPGDLVRACLESYAEGPAQPGQHWSLAEREKPANRQANLKTVTQRLYSLGKQLGYTVEGEQLVRWLHSDGEHKVNFFVFASSVVGRFILSPHLQPSETERCILVFPGSRSSLMAFKLQRDPHLAEIASTGWKFLKFRHLSRLAAQPDLTPARFETLIDQDPPLWEEPVQMKMFEDKPRK